MPHPPQTPLSHFTGVVVAAGRCAQTVRVRVMRRTWDSHIRKNYFVPEHHLADDYYSACVPGDVVRIVLGGVRTSRTKRHVVDEIVSPMRTGTERKKPEGIVAWLKRRGRWDYVQDKMMGGAGREWSNIVKQAKEQDVDPMTLQKELQLKAVQEAREGKRKKKTPAPPVTETPATEPTVSA